MRCSRLAFMRSLGITHIGSHITLHGHAPRRLQGVEHMRRGTSLRLGEHILATTWHTYPHDTPCTASNPPEGDHA